MMGSYQKYRTWFKWKQLIYSRMTLDAHFKAFASVLSHTRIIMDFFFLNLCHTIWLWTFFVQFVYYFFVIILYLKSSINFFNKYFLNKIPILFILTLRGYIVRRTKYWFSYQLFIVFRISLRWIRRRKIHVSNQQNPCEYCTWFDAKVSFWFQESWTIDEWNTQWRDEGWVSSS